MIIKIKEIMPGFYRLQDLGTYETDAASLYETMKFITSMVRSRYGEDAIFILSF